MMLFWIFFYFISNIFAETDSNLDFFNVTEINSDKIDEFIKINDMTLIKFCWFITFNCLLKKLLFWKFIYKDAPWCEHSRSFIPEFQKLARILNETHEIKVAQCDASSDHKLSNKYEITRFPTIKFFMHTFSLEYKGNLTS